MVVLGVWPSVCLCFVLCDVEALVLAHAVRGR